MADLDQVYGGMGGSDNEMNHHQQEETEYESRHHRENQQNHEPKPVPNQIEYPVPQQYNMPQQAPRRQFAPSYSFWDRMTLKRGEVIKLAMFSLVILLAIALDKISNHYLSKYISENVLSETQEFILRLSYPIMIFLILWVAKSL